MARSRRDSTSLRIRSDFNLGGEQAEADPLLDSAFVESASFKAVAAKDNERCFVIGRTGSGKSALLQRLEEMYPDHTIRINPEDLSLPYIIDLGVIRFLTALNVHLDPLFTALWKHVLLVEIIKHRYQVDSPAKKGNILTTLREAVKRDSSKRAALEYLDEFGERFWCETDERIREITTNFETRVREAGGAQLGMDQILSVSLDEEAESASSSQVRREQADRFQRIVNETQLARLNKMIAVLDEHVLPSQNNFVYILIDDLDRDWVDEQVANDLIRCLFRAVLDLKQVKHLKIVVALRTNIFDHLSFGSRGGGQEEKYRALQLRLRWTRQELQAVADERVRTAATRAGASNASSVADLLPETGRARGNPLDYVLERTLLRPRDLIAFLNECLTTAAGKTRLAWADITAAETQYSHNRLLALRDEWKPNFPGVDQALNVFRGAPHAISRSTMTQYLDAVALLAAEHDFPGVRWVTELSEPLWSGGLAPSEWSDSYQPLVAFLYNIGFIGIRNGSHTYYSYEASGYADAAQNLGTGTLFIVHPAFQPTLGVRKRPSSTEAGA